MADFTAQSSEQGRTDRSQVAKLIAVGRGDGIGPEIIEASLKVLERAGEIFGQVYETVDMPIGGAAVDACGEPFPASSQAICDGADAVLLGAVGGPKWDQVEMINRPERGLLSIRKHLGVYANLRPATIYPELKGASPLKEAIVDQGVDLLVVRELVGGIYFGEHGSGVERENRYAYDVERYDETEIRRIAVMAFETAQKRRGKVTSVDKANVLASSRLWRSVVEEVAADYPQVELNHLYVDNAAMQLVLAPRQFDVILTNNIFGDILSDEASQITGSIGLLPSASLGGSKGLYEPIHGSAPDLAGTGKANPLATILSVAMMLRYSFDQVREAQSIEEAVRQTLSEGYRTADLYRGLAGEHLVDCAQMAQAVADRLR